MTWKTKTKSTTKKSKNDSVDIVKIDLKISNSGILTADFDIQPNGITFAARLLAQMITGHITLQLLLQIIQRDPTVGKELQQLIPQIVSEIRGANTPIIKPSELFRHGTANAQ